VEKGEPPRPIQYTWGPFALAEKKGEKGERARKEVRPIPIEKKRTIHPPGPKEVTKEGRIKRRTLIPQKTWKKREDM